jgi:hypothetical protein
MTHIASAVRAMFPSLAGTLQKCNEIMDFIAVVENEIEKAQKKYPDRASFIYRSFMMFSDESDFFVGYDIRVWKAHVREILDRIGANVSTKEQRELGTDASALIAISRCADAAPLTRSAMLAMATLYGRILGEAAFKRIWKEGDDFKEDYPGESAEIIWQAKKTTSRKRVFPNAQLSF